jgi:ribosome modulation factor
MTICETTGAGVGLKRDRPTEASGKRAKRAHVVGGSAKRRSPRWATGDDSTITASVRTCVNESGDKRIRGDPCDLADSNMSPPRAGSNGRSRSLSPFRENSLERRDQRFVQEPGWRQRARNRLLIPSLAVHAVVDRVRGRDVQRVVLPWAMGHRGTCKVDRVRA